MINVKKYNKATASIIAGAVVQILGAVFVLQPEMIGALQVLLTSAAVLFIPNAKG